MLYMNSNIRKSSITLLIVVLCMCSARVDAALSPKEQAYYDNYQSILQVMKKAMDNAPKTGDPTLDFLYEMIPHHEAAVSMAENIAKYGSNERVKQLALTIIKEQLKGIGEMETLLNKLKKNPQIDVTKEQAYLKGYNEAYKQMIAAMQNAKPTGNIDRDFLKEMIPHHEGAVAMARNILNYTDNAELKAIAERIVASQQKQIAEMKDLLKIIK